MIAAGLLDRLQRLRSPRRTRIRLTDRRGVRSRRALPRLRARTVMILIAIALLLGGGWLWLRDSTLVAVKKVSITGVTGPDASQIRSALQAAAHNMTTLDVRVGQLKTAVAPFPAVKDLRVSAQFPHGLRIRVIEHVPVGAVVVGGRTIPVAGDGTLLRDLNAPAALPTIPLRVAPGGARLTEPDALDAVHVLAAAPDRLLTRISEVTTVAPHGLVAQVRNGPAIYFGGPDRLVAKWLSAATVLAASGSAGALYIDVTVPGRPVAGAGSSSSAAATGGSSSVIGSAATATPTGTTAPTGTTPATGTTAGTGTSASPMASGG